MHTQLNGIKFINPFDLEYTFALSDLTCNILLSNFLEDEEDEVYIFLIIFLAW